MGKILVLGNDAPTGVLASLSDVQFVQLPTLSVGDAGERDLNKFVINNICDDVGAIVIDVDKCTSPNYCLAVVVSIRLSLFEIKRNALAPIILSTEQTQNIFKNHKYSSVTLTNSVYIEKPGRIKRALDVVKTLEPSEYGRKFLNIIKILPNASEGRHSIANQWGAGVLGRIVLGNNALGDKIEEARLSMYFRYVQMQTIKVADIEHILNGGDLYEISTSPKRIVATNKKILLIDDEADKGWSDVLKKLFFGPQFVFETICEKVPDYESLSDGAREKIERGNYDLIFLDLRMNGVDEEDTTNPEDFSGMKILKKIKEINKGTQVIMFTASNKAWNLKALLDAGANGYYIKESPEYAFPFSHSESNARELRNTIKRCFDNGYHRIVYRKIQEIKELIDNLNNVDDKWKKESTMYLDIAFTLLSLSGDKNDGKNEYMAYSYLQLFLVIEKYITDVNIFNTENVDDELLLYNKNKEKSYTIVDREKMSVIYIPEKKAPYELGEAIYKNHFYDTNLKVSALLIFKFGKRNSDVYEWPKINSLRNKIAHAKMPKINEKAFYRILDFMKFFFNEKEAKWRDPADALPDETEKEQLDRLRERFNNR